MAKPKVSAATVSSVAALLGAKGGRARARNLSKRQLRAIARKASMAAKAQRERKRRKNGDGFAAMHADDFVHVSSKRPPRAAAKLRRHAKGKRKRST